MVPSDHRAVLTPAAGSTRQPCLSLTLTKDRASIRQRTLLLLSRGESHALQQVLKAGIGAEAVPLGIDLEEYHMHVSSLVTFFEPIQSMVLFAQGGIDHGDVVWRNVALLRLALQFFKHISRRILPAGECVRVSQGSNRLRVSLGKVAGFCKFFNCFPIHPLLLVDFSEVEVSYPKMRVHSYRLLQLFDRSVVLARLEEEHSKQRIKI